MSNFIRNRRSTGILKRLYERITFFLCVQKLFSCSAIIFLGFVESRETSESESSTFRGMTIPNKPQAVMLP